MSSAVDSKTFLRTRQPCPRCSHHKIRQLIGQQNSELCNNAHQNYKSGILRTAVKNIVFN